MCDARLCGATIAGTVQPRDYKPGKVIPMTGLDAAPEIHCRFADLAAEPPKGTISRRPVTG